MYRLTTDRARAIIVISVEGFWTVAEVERFAHDLGREARPLHAAGRRPALLYDCSRSVIQSQDVAAAWQEMARRAPTAARKVAVFTEGKLSRTQARRVVDVGPHLCVFEDREQALAWLADD